MSFDNFNEETENYNAWRKIYNKEEKGHLSIFATKLIHFRGKAQVCVLKK